MKQLLISLCGVFLTVKVNALPRYWRGEEFPRRQKEGESHIKEEEGIFFTQRLDHFDRNLQTTFQQRYFLNDTMFVETAASGVAPPVFLCVGGEGPPMDSSVLVASEHCNDMVELAPKFGALMLALEHRYYGPSTPNGEYSTDNLKYLNTEQALGDISYFHSYVSEMYNLSSANKWVTWGGSYPGMLSALARLRYPHLIHAAVSSSSPLNAQVEMEEYNEVVASSISAEIVGGSEACLNAVTSGHAAIGEMLATSDGRRNLEEMFNLCTPNSLEDTGNQEQFAGDGVIYIPVQSNDPSCGTPYCNIASICDFMTSQDDSLSPIEKLAQLSKTQHLGQCVSVSYQAMLKAMALPKNPIRSWLYQTCTEWGFYQTCPTDTTCPYTQGLHTLQVDYDICESAFGISSDEVQAQIAYTRSLYGAENIQGSRIMYPNGQIDPWSALGILKTPAGSSEQPTLWVEGAR